jgi:glycosyltransferase involved in cell wall biosynthesis
MVIAIVIPAYNQADLLKKCVLSLINCNYPKSDYQIIIVDNASTDHTRQVIGELKHISQHALEKEKKYNSKKEKQQDFKFLVCVYHKENRNAAAARNTGVLHAREDVKILAFIDQDCEVPRNWLEIMKDMFKKDRDLAFIGGLVLSKPHNIWQEWALHMSHRICDYEDYQTRVIGTNMAFRQYVFWDNYFDEDVAYGTDETEFVFRLSIKGFRYAICHDLIVYHYHRDNFLDLVRQRWRYGQGEARFYHKYGFSIYHPVNTYMLKINLSLLGSIGFLLLGHPWLSAISIVAWIRYMIKYGRIRYQSFLKGRKLPSWKILVFIGINWVVDNVVLAAKLRIGNPI